MNRTRKYSLDESFFDTIDTESKAYWLGFISADGYVNHSGVTFGLKATDAGHLERFLADLGSSSPVRFGTSIVNGKQRQYARASVCSTMMSESLMALGVTRNKSLTISPCTAIPPELERHYWRGVFDGDGCIIPMKNKQAYRMSLVGTRAMLDGFAAFADLHTHLRPAVSKIKNANAFRISYCGVQGVQLLARSLYDEATVYLSRKKETVDSLLSVTPLVSRIVVHARRQHAVERSA